MTFNDLYAPKSAPAKGDAVPAPIGEPPTGPDRLPADQPATPAEKNPAAPTS